MFNRIKKIVLYFLLLYGFFGFLLIPLFLKSKLVEIVQNETKATATIEGVYFNPFIFKLKLEGVTLFSPNKLPLLSFESFLVNFEPNSLLYGAIHIKEVTLKSPKLSLIYEKDRTINLLNIIKKEETYEDNSTQESKIPHIVIDKVAVIDGGVFYKDFTRKKPFVFSFEKIGFHLKDIDTNDINSSSAKLRLYTTLGDGGFIDFTTDIVGFKPFKVKGSLDFEASKLYTEWRYIQEQLNLEVADGKVSLHGEYALNLDDLNSTTVFVSNISLDKLRIKPKNSFQDILNLHSLDVKGVSLYPFMQKVKIDKIALNGLNIKVKRKKDGTIDWVHYLEVKKEESAKDANKTQTQNTQRWKLKVDDISLQKIAVVFKDEAIKPAVVTDVNAFNLYAQNLTLLGKKPLHFQMNTLLNNETKCKANGVLVHKKLNLLLQSSCENFDLVHYQPYIDTIAQESLKKYDLHILSALIGFNANVKIETVDKQLEMKVLDTNITLAKFKIKKKSTNEVVASWKNFLVSGINFNLASKDLSVTKSSLSGLKINAKRYKNGTLNFENLVIVKENKKTVTKTKPMSLKLKHFALENARVNFKDELLSKTTQTKLDKIYFNAYDMDIKKGTWLRYALSMRVNTKGRLKAKGKLRHTPLKQKGTFDIKNISLKELTPYLQESAYVKIDDGSFSLKGSSLYFPSKKSPDLRVQSSFSLDSLFVNDSRDNSSLLSLSEVKTDAFTLELSPNRLYVNELDVMSFYVNAVIDANKTINFAQLSKVKEKQNDVPKEKFPINISKVNVSLGSAKFADYSIPIKFSTHIHHLDGVIYAISNMPGETSYVNLSGEIDKYGSTRLKGSIDGSDPKLYTNLDFNFKNLELSSMSGYSASFAGYEIASGKLYLDLGYDVVNSELHGRNNVMIKKIVLGREIEDENVTVLPLGFVIGLLEDNDGIIDIDMPVEGNLQEPDFKYGALIWKTLGSLITNAVTSPFKFLGAMMGINAEDLAYIEFEPASSRITPPEREKLDKITKMMRKKPKISLAVAGVYCKDLDLRALKLEKLIDLVMLKSGLKNRKDHESVMSNKLLEDIYTELENTDSLGKLQEKLHIQYKDATYDREYHTALIRECTRIQKVTEAELHRLAQKRADIINSYLIEEKMIPKARIIQKKVKEIKDPDSKTVKLDIQIEVK